jgi:hypothetical protein
MSAAADALARALRAEGASVEHLASRAWASAGASGERHRLAVRLSGDAADRLLDRLGEREFDLAGFIVADIALVGEERRGGEALLVVEALTIPAD